MHRYRDVLMSMESHHTAHIACLHMCIYYANEQDFWISNQVFRDEYFIVLNLEIFQFIMCLYLRNDRRLHNGTYVHIHLLMIESVSNCT